MCYVCVHIISIIINYTVMSKYLWKRVTISQLLCEYECDCSEHRAFEIVTQYATGRLLLTWNWKIKSHNRITQWSLRASYTRGHYSSIVNENGVSCHKLVINKQFTRIFLNKNTIIIEHTLRTIYEYIAVHGMPTRCFMNKVNIFKICGLFKVRMSHKRVQCNFAFAALFIRV